MTNGAQWGQKYGVHFEGEWDETVSTTIQNTLSRVAERFFDLYQSQNLITYTVEANPTQYPEALAETSLFHTIIGTLTLSPSQADTLLEVIAQHIDKRYWHYGARMVKTTGSTHTWERLFAGWVHGDSKIDAWLVVIVASGLANSSVPDDPQKRLEVTRSYYLDTGFGFGFADSVRIGGDALGYGRSQVDFTLWEARRGVLNPMDSKKPGSRWWRAVNGQIMRDMEEGRILKEAGISTPGSNEAVDRWRRYVTQDHATAEAQHWYIAHDFSVTLGYMDYIHLALLEEVDEQVLMADVLDRLLLAQAMVTAVQTRALGNNLLADIIEAVLEKASLPEGIAVKLIVNVPEIYPENYPLSPGDKNSRLLLYYLSKLILGDRGTLSYASVTPARVCRLIIKTFFKNLWQSIKQLFGAQSSSIS